MVRNGSRESPFSALVQAIAIRDSPAAARLLAASPELALEHARDGATRQSETAHWLDAIQRYLYAGDTALHIAAAAYQKVIAADLITKGADTRARNRRGAEPLHYAADGVPASPAWNPDAQAATIACLIAAGADPNAVDKSGVTPLHRAVRTRCAAAVQALLEGGADAYATNKSGSTPILLATRNTGRGGSGSPEAKEQQKGILRLLREYGAE